MLFNISLKPEVACVVGDEKNPFCYEGFFKGYYIICIELFSFRKWNTVYSYLIY